MKHRIVHTLQKYVLNPPIKLALAIGLPLPGYALLETKGRKTGKPRRTPVGDGRIENQFWLVAEHGMKAGYVRNIERDPHVRLKLREGLSVSLRQSPFLNVLSDSEVAKTLQLMTLPAGTRLTPEVARELCQRAGSKAHIAGSIGSLGSEFVLGLKAVNCQNGDTLAQEQVTAAAKEKVLDALGKAASKLRTELGESLATVQKFDVPLAEAGKR